MIWKTAIFIAGFLTSFAYGADVVKNPLKNQLGHDSLQIVFKLLDAKSLYQLATTHSDFFKILRFMFSYMPFLELNLDSKINRNCILHDSTIPMDISFTFKFPIDENMRDRIIPIFTNLASNTYKNEDKKLEFIPEDGCFILSEIPAHRPQYYDAVRVIDGNGNVSYPTVWNRTRQFPLHSRFRFDLSAGKMTVERDSKGVYQVNKDEALEMLNMVNENGKMCLHEGKVFQIIRAISDKDPSTSTERTFEKFSKNRFEEILNEKEQVYIMLQTTKMSEINLKTSQSQEEFENDHHNLLSPSQFDDESFNRLTFAEGTRANIIALKKNPYIPLLNLEVHEYTAIDALKNIMQKMNHNLLRHCYYEFVIKAKDFKKSSDDKKDDIKNVEKYIANYFLNL